MDPEIEEIEVESDDYYALLNLPRDVSSYLSLNPSFLPCGEVIAKFSLIFLIILN